MSTGRDDEGWGTVQDPRGPDEQAPKPQVAKDEESGVVKDSGNGTSPPTPWSRVAERLRPRRPRSDARRLSWRALAPWRYRSTRFEPGPLGLLGVMLAAMAVTLLLVQTGSGGTGGPGAGDDGDPVAVPGPPEGELRVMVVGDSLSQGSSGDYTWRYHLWSHLRQTDVDVDFVGPYDGMYGLTEEEFDNQDYADPDFDTDHAARWGASAGDLAADAARVAAEYEPHYMLLLAGIEDILAGDGADRALEGIGETVSTVRVVQGETRFVIGELPPVEGTGDDGPVNDEIDRFNMGVVDLAEQLTSGDSPVVIARIADGYVPAHDNWDEAHPNTRGELKIAAAFADVLADPLGVGGAYRRPLPEMSVGPLRPVEPTAEESDDGLVLTWETVPGATDYRVVQRRISPAPDEPFVLPVDVDLDGDRGSVLVEALFSGADYEFVVRSYKGRDEGAESEPLRWVWDDEPPPGPSWVRVRDGGSVVEWEPVEEASHYEVWVRVLDCSPSNDRRLPVDAWEGTGPTDDPDDGGGEGPPSAGDGPPRPEPEPPSTPTPRPPGPDGPAPTPDVPEPVPGPDCERRDGRGPGSGQGWHTLGSVGEDTHWSATLSGAYEVVVRSYRDYVEGGHSDSVLLSEGR
ncbi:GDSL-type esterase/lipase family protein [Nocardiopsis sp. ATB16-24]|uniref:GDSL-type esterase/lipase family protein n=1 Tax=Nocardiopsis sp. ATB16-24 TaxID=3019555 RepID=UPI00255780C7|nr:GDSL-type esterase/lipase family protein [Nocardiopsis sp. ATB16-24]